MTPKWEPVALGVKQLRREHDENYIAPTYTERLRVPGGWLYRTVQYGTFLNDAPQSVVFVPEASS